jgi:hypothetical protein
MARLFLGKPQTSYQWVGVLVTTAGLIPIVLVGYFRDQDKDAIIKHYKEAHGKSEEEDSLGAYLWVPYLLVVVSEVMKAVRYLYEERLIKIEKMSAEFVVYMESLVGLAISLIALVACHFITKPDGKPVEDLVETFDMMGRSYVVVLLVVAHFLIVGVSNYATTLVTKYLSSILNSILSQARTIVVWLPMVFLGAFGPVKCRDENNLAEFPGIYAYGEPFDWLVPYLFLGFGMVTVGALIYNGDIKVPFGPKCQPPSTEKGGSCPTSPETPTTNGEKEQSSQSVVVV